MSPLVEAAQVAADRRPWLRLTNDPSVNRHILLDVLRHGATVWSIAWSPRGDRIASAGSDGTVRLWDIETGINVAHVSPKAGQSNTVAWSPDGTMLATGHDDSTLRIWSANSLELVCALDLSTAGILKAAWSPSGDHLAVGAAQGTVILVNWPRREVRRIGKHNGEVHALAWSPDGLVLASGGSDAAVRLWERRSGFRMRALLEDRLLLQRLSELFHGTGPASAVLFEAAVLSLAWSPNGSTLVSGSRTGVLRFWDPVGGKPGDLVSGDWSNGAGVWSLAWSSDGLLALGVGAGQIVLADPVRRQQALLPLGHSDAVRGLSFAVDKHALASCGDDGTVRLWDARTLWTHAPSMLDPSQGGHGATLTRLAWSGNGRFLVSGDHNCSVSAWDVQTGRRVGSIERLAGPVLAASAATRGVLLAPFGRVGDTQVMSWESPEANLAVAATVQGPVTALALSPDGRILASGDVAGTLWLTKMEDSSLYRVFVVQNALGRRPEGLIPVWGLAWSPDGRFVAAGGGMGLMVWNAHGGLSPNAVLLHPSSDHGGGTSGEMGFGERVLGMGMEDHAVAWSPDGAMLASSSADHAIRLWRPATGELVAVLDEHKRSVTALHWSLDGALLASAGNDATVRVWDVGTRRRIALAYCLSPVMLVRFDDEAGFIRAADNGAATGLRPIPWTFELRGSPPRDSSGHPSKITLRRVFGAGR